MGVVRVVVASGDGEWFSGRSNTATFQGSTMARFEDRELAGGSLSEWRLQSEGAASEGDALLEDMRRMALSPDERTYTLLLNHIAVLARQGRATPHDAQRVATMMRNSGIAPTSASVETHLDVLDSAASFGQATTGGFTDTD
ncbi:hypothetical protein T484DRAFT_1773641 [Baffinella frigidus]|nr:hypothetical protein T484DRAFT_1773641 [Cryptophyta sp. CCMP2293]